MIFDDNTGYAFEADHACQDDFGSTVDSRTDSYDIDSHYGETIRSDR